MKTAQLKTLVKNVILEWQASVAEEKVPGTVYLDDLGVKYSPDELRVMKMAVNTFSKGGHPMPDDKSIEFFGRNFVLQCLKKGEKLLTGKAKYAKDLALVKALIPKISKNPITKEDSAEFKDGITNNMKAVNLEGVRNLSVPEKHQLRIALQTLKMTDAGANIMGGMNKEEARSFLKSKGYSDQAIQRLEGNVGEELNEIQFPSGETAVLGGIISTIVYRLIKDLVSYLKQGKIKNVEDLQKVVDTSIKSKQPKLDEMSTTGGVAGYMTPNAFTKNKKGSPRGIEAAKKYGKVVGEAPRV